MKASPPSDSISHWLERLQSTRPGSFKTLEDWLSWTVQAHPKKIDMGLERITEVASRLGVLQFDAPIITVAGTNGKGSTIKALESVYLAAGYRVAATTSPHVFSLCERLRLNGEQIDESILCQAFEAVEKAKKQISLTYFEYVTLASFWIIKHSHVEVILLEIGLGGRLDAMNVVDANVAIITGIALDHQAFLGNTRDAIAKEKAGIIKLKQKGVVIGDSADLPVIEDKAKACEVPYLRAQPLPLSRYHLPKNSLECAAAAIELLNDCLPVDKNVMMAALEQAVLFGRWTTLSKSPELILDVAHNEQAAHWLAARCQRFSTTGKTHVVFSAFSDKPIKQMLAPFAALGFHWYLGQVQNERSETPQTISRYLSELGVQTQQCFGNILEAYQAARVAAHPEDRILLFGGFGLLSALEDVLKKETTYAG